jgi:hypothetical protein
MILHGFSNVERFSDVCNIMIRICSMSTEGLCIGNQKKTQKEEEEEEELKTDLHYWLSICIRF